MDEKIRPERHTAKLASYVILEREDGKILLMRRAGTGYMDGMYQMPSGHIDPNEYPAEAARRETKEETGVDVAFSDLEFVHVLYRIKEDASGDYVDFFYKTKKWTGEIQNMEPDKCDDLLWVSMDELPENTVPVIKQVLGHIQNGVASSGFGRAE